MFRNMVFGGTFFALLAGSATAQLQDPLAWSKSVLTIGNGVSLAIAGDSGALSNIARLAVNPRCTQRRSRNLSRSYRNYINATASQDADQMFAAAKDFHWNAITRSSQYASCWRTIRDMSQAGGKAAQSAADIVALGPKPSA